MPTIELTDAEAKTLTEALQVAEETYKLAFNEIVDGRPNTGTAPSIVEQQMLTHFTNQAAECKRIALKLDVAAPKPKRRKARK